MLKSNPELMHFVFSWIDKNQANYPEILLENFSGEIVNIFFADFKTNKTSQICRALDFSVQVKIRKKTNFIGITRSVWEFSSTI